MIKTDAMTKNLDIINAAVTVIIKSAILAAQFSGRVRKRSLKRLSRIDIDDKDKEIIFLNDKVTQQQMQITLLQKKQTNKRYPLREKLLNPQLNQRKLKIKLRFALSLPGIPITSGLSIPQLYIAGVFGRSTSVL